MGSVLGGDGKRLPYRGKSPITDPLQLPTPSRIPVTIIDINTIHELLVI